MIRYTCGQCGAKLESPDSLGGELDKCPACGFACAVPSLKPPRRRAFLIVGGAAGLLAGAVLAVVITSALTSGTGLSPMPSKGSPGPKTTAKAVVPSAVARQEPTDEAAMMADMKARADRLMPQPPATAPAWKSAPLVDAQPAPRPAPAPLSPEQVFEKASPAVVYITVRDKDFKPIGLGSGFFVDANGLVVTNYHVIKGAEFATARLSTGATLFLDGVVATDPNGDLALLKVSGGGFPCLKNAEPALPRIGSAVYAIGNPQGLENTFSSGMVSGHREISQGLKVIQVTAPISPGSSGGPLLNTSGEVVGVTTAHLTGGQNLNFAIPVSAISALIRKQGKVQTLASAGGGRLNSTDTEELDKAWAAINKKDWAAAVSILTKLRKTEKDNPVVWYALGHLHGALGNGEIAIEHYKVAITLKPDYADAYEMLALAYLGLKRYTEAIAAYETLAALKPDNAYPYDFIGTAYVQLERYPEAIEAYKKAVAIDPNDSLAYCDLGDAYCHLNQYAEALAAYKKVVVIKPPVGTVPPWLMKIKTQATALWTSRAYRGMGDAYLHLKRHTEAIAAFRNAVAIDPNDFFSYYNMGEAYLGLNRQEDASAAFKKAIALKPDDAMTYFVIGTAYGCAKHYAEALSAYEQFLRLEPAGARADDLRKMLPELRRLAGK